QNQAGQEINQDRLTRANAKLEAVANGQEYQAASKEIDQLKKLNESLAEQLGKLGQDAETIQKEIAGVQEKIDAAQAEYDAQAETVNAKAGELDGRIAELQKERAKYVGAVDRRTLAQYDRIRGARHGLGFVP